MRTLMKVLKNLFGNNTKINTNAIAFKDSNNDIYSLDDYLKRGNVYSTSEKKIGTWIDGKNLYQKTFNNYTLINGNVFDDIILETNPNINIKNSYGYFILKDGSLTYQTSIGESDVGFGAISNVNKNSSGLLYINRTHGAYGTLKNLEVTIEYTKTTD